MLRSLCCAVASASLFACSGEAFHLIEQDAAIAAAGQQSFPDLTPTGADGTPPDEPDAGAQGGSSGASNQSDSAPPLVPISLGPCGALRGDGEDSFDLEVCVENASFEMGSNTPNLGGGYSAHGPMHTVTLSAYALDAREVSVGRYRACVSDGDCSAPSSVSAQGCTFTAAPGDNDSLPITCVSWNDAAKFCSWDGGRRLPTEAEWEHAARGSANSRYPWGDDFECDRAVLGGAAQCSAHAGGLPQPVGSKPRGRAQSGAFDLAGNAAEWVADWFGAYGATPQTDPEGPGSGSARIQRGGSWLTRPVDAVAWARRAEAPGAIGPFSFRCARDATE